MISDSVRHPSTIEIESTDFEDNSETSWKVFCHAHLELLTRTPVTYVHCSLIIGGKSRVSSAGGCAQYAYNISRVTPTQPYM